MAAKKASEPPSLHELEAKVMEGLWDVGGEARVRAVLDAVNARQRKPVAYTTVMTILHRLDRKGLVSRRREGKSDVYCSTWTRDEYVQARAEREVAEIIDRFGDAALVHFNRQMQQLDPKRRERLRRLARRA